MGTNKTTPTDVSVGSFIRGIVPPEKQSDATVLADLMMRATGHAPKMWGSSIVGFGMLHYRYETGREGETVLVGFSPRKPAIVLYGIARFDGAEALLAKLGTYTAGKGCIYIKKLSDVDHDVLAELITKSAAARKAGRTDN